MMTPPFHIRGAVGSGLGDAWFPFFPLAGQAELAYRSLAADRLAFQVRPESEMPTPDQDQPIALADATGAIVFRGRVTKRKYRFSSGIFEIEAAGPWQALVETSLTGDNGRPYVAYPMQAWSMTMADILRRAAAAGIPIAAPNDYPPTWEMPKMAFRAATYSEAILRMCALVPDIATRMDYSTPVPTLRFFCRATTPSWRRCMDVTGHGISEAELDESVMDRLLAISFAYCRREGDSVIRYLVQTAGNDAAEARRKVSIFLSGPERTDMFVTEALTTAQKAVAKAAAAIAAVNAAVDSAAATAGLAMDWATIKTRDSAIQSALAVGAFTMGGGGSYALWNGCAYNGGSAATYYQTTYSAAPLTLRNQDGSPASGWWPVRSDAFTSGQLQAAGATKETRYIRGELLGIHGGEGSAGMHALPTHTKHSGWIQNHAVDSNQAASFWREVHIYPVNVSVDAINMPPSEVASKVKAIAAGGDTSLVERAEFTEAPEGLAAFWFRRQDYPHFRGSLTMRPGSEPPMPGDFVSIEGEGTLPAWAAMAAPVSEVRLNLADGSAGVELGPPAAFDVAVIDRIWVPPDDNYQQG